MSGPVSARLRPALEPQQLSRRHDRVMADSSGDALDDGNQLPDPVSSSVATAVSKVAGGEDVAPRWPAGVDLSLRVGNPHYGRRMQLYCRTGYHLTIGEDATVAGVDADMTDFAIMEFTSAGFGGLVRIRGVHSHLYLAMNKKGLLYGEVNPEAEETVFIEGVLGQYNTYMSNKFKKLQWYVGIKKTGKQKPGHKTKWGQKAIQFLPRRLAE